MICGLAAVGVILTPIYLLSMLREIFFGRRRRSRLHTNLVDAEPREIYIIGCLLVLIIGIGLYPRLMTDSTAVRSMPSWAAIWGPWNASANPPHR